jgi:hypothetical protein
MSRSSKWISKVTLSSNWPYTYWQISGASQAYTNADSVMKKHKRGQLVHLHSLQNNQIMNPVHMDKSKLKLQLLISEILTQSDIKSLSLG